jgi:sugar O-acyltransferase (sialic acid O-acetyltransferase NeuD family)
MKNIAVVGSSGHAKVVVDIIEKQGIYAIAGFIDMNRSVGEKTLNYDVLGKEEDLPKLISSHHLHGIIIAIGDNFIRSQVVNKIKHMCPDICFVTAVHPLSCIAKTASLGQGTVAMAGSIVNPSCKVGEFCILNTNSALDHDSKMDDFSSLAPNVTTGGNCEIGHASAVGIGATLIHGITVGEHSIVGAGSTVLKDVEPYCISFGTPAITIRSRQQGDTYL